MPASLHEIILLIKGLFNAGGYVMPPLLFCALLLWYGLGYRYWTLKSSRSMSIHDMLDYYSRNAHQSPCSIVEQAVQQGLVLRNRGIKNLRRFLDEIFYGYLKEIRRFSVMTKTIVVISPLLGLLGTVIGMIETFDSLGSMSLFTQSGGIAGGISQALISTQTGLAVAIPGMLLHSMLHKKQQKIERELLQIRELLCVHSATLTHQPSQH
ncbi:MAG: MotA/TolQ/ExbB proton channel family protein [Nitrosomonas sp.]|jgi:biopolymer transport protein ExbB|nr:MotA/TolQ/ExbB proton channel family protein [Nitrosomonas sp.]MDR4652618.1 MotA/TolQ/ExbB proton channel family protein [Nitrosomonas sp.]HQU61841.1 MotA/TolQ/ExbB proton channel family protein [Nitrosomonas sp.]